MTLNEIKFAHKKYWLGVYIFGGAGIAVLFSASNNTCIEIASGYLDGQLFSLSALIVGLFMVAGGIFLSARWYLPKCPSCKKSLPPNQLGVIVATKNCPLCGENVIN